MKEVNNNKMIPKIIFLIFLSCSFCGCQLISMYKTKKVLNIATPLKPKIGLFISGVGANTFSAISLLQLLHQQKIHFDYYGGTGWGAWLAALYAKNQSINDLKWNIFKLKEQGLFKSSWFNIKFNKKLTGPSLLKFLEKEIFSTPINTHFVCPVLNHHGKLLWMTKKNIVLSLLNCTNKLPPLFLSFHHPSNTVSGSLFSADLVMQYMQKQKLTTLIWIKPLIAVSLIKSNTNFLIFWKELSAYLDTIKNHSLKNNPKIIILETKYPDKFLVNDFSQLHTIIKTPAPLKEQEIIYKLKLQLQKREIKKNEPLQL